MRTVPGYVLAEQRIGQFQLSHFCRVRALTFEGDFHRAAVVRLSVATEDRQINWQLTLAGVGVQDLQVNGWGGAETRITGLQCVDIRDRQWEGLEWEVSDYQGGMIKFYCSELEIVNVLTI
jgi:hypothetical protein